MYTLSKYLYLIIIKFDKQINLCYNIYINNMEIIDKYIIVYKLAYNESI